MEWLADILYHTEIGGTHDDNQTDTKTKTDI